MSWRRPSVMGLAFIALLLLALSVTPALASFPYARPGADTSDFTDLYLTNQVPNDIGGDSNEFKYSASADPANVVNNALPTELGGVRGGHLVDADSSKPTAWKKTTGRPDVTIATLDSGIEWNNQGAMNNVRFKTRLNRGELPAPRHDRNDPLVPGATCGSYADAHDANGDAVFNIADYACDSRVNLTDPRRDGPAGYFTPQDVLIAFSDSSDADSNGFVDDIIGWDFLDDDNDPFDDVQYGHGTGEVEGSASEADNGGAVGSCPNCMAIHMRVGDSFVADVNRFAAAVIYATDNDVQVVQEALGALNNSSLARDAVNYAFRHGVTVIASAADEAAQHNHWPASLPHVIMVNSVTRDLTPAPNQPYTAFNGCTNFYSKLTLSIPSTSCSSDAVGVGSGMAGLVYSAAYSAYEKGALAESETCELVGDGPDADPDGPDPCVISATEVRQLMAAGRVDGQAVVDDIDFAGLGGPNGPEPACAPIPLPGCTDPNGLTTAQSILNRPKLVPNSFSYPARGGHDQFYGYGRVNLNRGVSALLDDPADPSDSLVPPEVELTSPEWYEQIDPARSSFEVRGEIFARGGTYSCRVLVAPGHYPNQAEAPTGDFRQVPSPLCDGSTRTQPIDGVIADVSTATLKSYFPIDATASSFSGRESGASGVQTSSGRPNTDPYGFNVKVVATTTQDGHTLTGEDYRTPFLHRDQDMLDGFPKAISGGGEVASSPQTPTADGESSPLFADLDGDNRNELLFGSTDGFVHAVRPDGTELPGWPVRGDRPGFVADHTGGAAYESGAVSDDLGGAMLASIAVADANADGKPEVYAADLEGRLIGWDDRGVRIFEQESDPAFGGAPLAGEPFVENRAGEFNRVQHGFIGSPVLADIDGDDRGKLEIVAAAMDRHVYAWNHDGSTVDGYPLLVVDPGKVEAVDPETHRITFASGAGSKQQGAIIVTPAVGDLDGDADEQGEDELPEIVVGTNEEYGAGDDGGFNAAAANNAIIGVLTQAQEAIDGFRSQCGDPCDALDLPLSPGNTRLYALDAGGDPDPDPLPGAAIRPGWPAKLGILSTDLLPVVGEGVTGAPVIAPARCSPAGEAEPRVGASANNGPAYVLDSGGDSCYGKDQDGRDVPLQSDFGVSPQQFDRPALAAVGHPAFGDLGGDSPSFLTPTAGLFRALDLALPEYQRSQDFVAAWSVEGAGQFRPGYPAPVNDLQFLTGPTVADVDGQSGEEVLAATSSKDFTALTPTGGVPVNNRWPKLTTDWTVANPLIGSFGTLDTNQSARKVAVNLTRSGYVNAYETDAPACSPSSWPRFHHDNANSGDYGRDAVLPGKPTAIASDAGAVTFTAPGDDLLCGTADHYEVVTSAKPIDESNFGDATPLADAPTPGVPGTTETYTVAAGSQRYVAVRAVDEQGNVGRVASIDFLGPEPQPPGCLNAITGTAARDVLVGTAAGDLIKGGRGNDKIRGLGGDDCIKPGRGRDKARGGTGDDVIRDAGRARDRINCGPGDDTAIVSRRDKVKKCEAVKRRG